MLPFRAVKLTQEQRHRAIALEEELSGHEEMAIAELIWLRDGGNHAKDKQSIAEHSPYIVQLESLALRLEELDSHAGEAIAIRALIRDFKEEWSIVDRIWRQLGNPSYEELNGRSIYDLIGELKMRAEL